MVVGGRICHIPDCQRTAGGLGAAAPQDRYFRTDSQNKQWFSNGALPWSDLATSLPRRGHQPVASRSLTSQSISQSDYSRPLIGKLSASCPPISQADKQAISQSCKSSSHSISKPSNRPASQTTQRCASQSVRGCDLLMVVYYVGCLAIGGGWLMPVGCGTYVVCWALRC